MDLWRARKRYRQLGLRLRRSKTRSEALRRAEEQVIVALLLGDRLETERSVLRFARRCAQARLRRLRAWVEGAGLLAEASVPLVRRGDEAAVEDLRRVLGGLGAVDAAAAAHQLLVELSLLDARLADTQARINRVGVVAGQHLEQLLSYLHAGLDQLNA